MNERIKQLAKEAAREMNETGTYSEPKFQEKFAELIVLECAKIADEGCGSACFGLGINGAMLKEHFGVEE
jgi:hypothetical protein